MVPSHIQKTITSDIRNSPDGVTVLDIVVSSVAVNSGISDMSLQLQ